MSVEVVASLIGTLAAAAAALAGGWVTTMKARREAKNTEYEHLDELYARQEARIGLLEAAVVEAARRERAFASYVFRLQHHIAEGRPPPPPPWPKTLLPSEEEPSVG